MKYKFSLSLISDCKQIRKYETMKNTHKQKTHKCEPYSLKYVTITFFILNLEYLLQHISITAAVSLFLFTYQQIITPNYNENVSLIGNMIKM